MRPRTAASPLLVAALLVTAGCSALSAPPNDPTAEAIVERAAATAQDVESYRYDGDIDAHASNGDEERTIRGSMNGSVNVSRREAVTVATLDGDTQRSYLLDGHALAPCRRFADAEYERQDLPTDHSWVNGTVLASLTEPSIAARYTLVENTTVDGDPASVVVVHPDLDALADRNRAFGGAGTTDYSNAENVTVRLTVDRESYRVEHATVRVVAEDGGATGTVTMTLAFAYEPVGPLDVPDAANVTDDSPWCGN